MKEPRKLLDGAGDTSVFAAELLRTGRRETLPPQARAAIWKGIALQAPGSLVVPSAGAGAGGASAAGAGTAAVKGVTLVALLKGTVAVVALGGGLWAGHHALTARGDAPARDATTVTSRIAQAGAPRAGGPRKGRIEAPTQDPTEDPTQGLLPATSALGTGDASLEPARQPGPHERPAAQRLRPGKLAPLEGFAKPVPAGAVAERRARPAPVAGLAVVRSPERASGPGAAQRAFDQGSSSPSLATNAARAGGGAEIRGDGGGSAAIPAPTSLLAEENRLVLAARAGLKAGHVAAVLALLEAGKRRLPDGSTLAQEREALTIEALWRLGHTDEARRRAEVFTRAYPGSPHATHLARIIGQ